jgi:hypothetical protein
VYKKENQTEKNPAKENKNQENATDRVFTKESIRIVSGQIRSIRFGFLFLRNANSWYQNPDG